ncbi:MAG: AraC family transcriptional regulator, partial [Enterococcus thailandicus]|nr:AraC family transcriptional regulator [Enterococcus thailandicus]
FEIHGIRNIKETSYPDSVLTIIFPTPWIEKYFPDIAKFRINQSKISQESVTKKQYAMFISELDSLFELVKKPVDRINNVMITASLLKLLGMYVKEFAIEQAENSSHLLDEKIYKILDYIHKNSDQRLKISMIADEFYLSEGYLSRYFNSKVGVSIISYLELIRSYQAIQLIRETDRTIEEIALETGFASTKSLNKTLKKYYNQTAKFFR